MNGPPCVMTGVSLYGCDAVLLPLAPAYIVGGGRNHPTALGGVDSVNNHGAAAMFAPLTLPICGKVWDFQGLDVAPDAHTAILARRLGDPDLVDFLDTARSCGGRRNDGKHPTITRMARRVNSGTPRDNGLGRGMHWNGTLSQCWVSRAAWDTFSVDTWDNDGRAEGVEAICLRLLEAKAERATLRAYRKGSVRGGDRRRWCVVCRVSVGRAGGVRARDAGTLRPAPR